MVTMLKKSTQDIMEYTPQALQAYTFILQTLKNPLVGYQKVC